MKQQEPCNDCGKTHPFFECDKAKPMTNEERIKADAEALSGYNENRGDGGLVNKGRYYGYIAGATAERERAKVLVDALEELITLKNMKDELGKTTDYLTRQPQAWKQANEALAKWKGEVEEPQVELSCMVCGTTFMGPEPQMCCSGRDCGCMGLPVDPIVCSKECYEKGLPRQKGDSGIAIN